MPQEVHPYKLSEIGTVSRGRSRHRPRDAEFLYGGPYPFFQTGDIKAANYYLHDYKQTYSEAGLAQSKLWPKGTLCITIAANIAETAILKIPGCFPDSVVGFTPDPSKADVGYIKYYIDTIKVRMQSASRGTTQDNLSVDKLLTFNLQLPSLKVQKKIAAILSAYDDLIENNTRRIAILEEMARLIYREWFVHFRFPGHEDAKFVDSELGRVPEGWEVKLVADLLERLKAKNKYTEKNVEPLGEVPVVDQSTDEVLGYHNTAPDFEASSEKPLAIFGDHTCKMQLLVEPFSIGPNVIPFTSKPDNSLLYVFFLINQLVETREYKRHWNDLVSKVVVVCGPKLGEQFASLVAPMMELIANLKKQNSQLRQTRDLLLPRLISGELDVSGMEITGVESTEL